MTMHVIQNMIECYVFRKLPLHLADAYVSKNSDSILNNMCFWPYHYKKRTHQRKYRVHIEYIETISN